MVRWLWTFTPSLNEISVWLNWDHVSIFRTVQMRLAYCSLIELPRIGPNPGVNLLDLWAYERIFDLFVSIIYINKLHIWLSFLTFVFPRFSICKYCSQHFCRYIRITGCRNLPDKVLSLSIDASGAIPSMRRILILTAEVLSWTSHRLTLRPRISSYWSPSIQEKFTTRPSFFG
jgi:hypothetical protein